MSPCTAIGIDVGGTKIAGGLVTLPEGRVHATRRWPTRADRTGEAILDDVLKMAVDLRDEARSQPGTADVLGIGVCELVTPDGEVVSSNAVPWRGMPIRERLSTIAPSVVEADVRAAARAEAVLGAGRGVQNFVYVTVGTGISCCLVLDGRPYTGARGAAGTMASSPWTRQCEGCGRVDLRSVEDLASGPGLVARWNRLVPDGRTTASRAEEVLAAAARGEVEAIEVVASAGTALGVAVGGLVNVLDPEKVIIGGGLGLARGLFHDTIVASTRRHIWSDLHRDLPIEPAQTAEHAGWLGAAIAAWQGTRR